MQPTPPSPPPRAEPSSDLSESPSATPTDDITEPPSPTTPEPPASSEFVAPKGSVPGELVGEWDGDGTSARFDKIRFSSGGDVSLIYNSGLVLEGSAVVDGTSMTLYVPGGPIPYAYWSIEEFDAGYGYTFENLRMDGISYVRQIAGG
ncbi:hypothetical protein ACFUKV_10605 [Streptomyces paradoxus]|uniref:hypothetical protein n=1 Tax=Streptomyces paradoxus TaxID=66375 RepID=UPI0036293864